MSDYERVKDAVNLQTVITQETSLKMKKHHLEECPFCGDHDCFSIKEHTYKCFQCDASGSGFLIMNIFTGKNVIAKSGSVIPEAI